MQYVWMAIKGVFIGISNIIPGVSGGTMAVSFGIYDDVIHSFTHIKKEFKSSFKVLAPLVVGILIGAAGFSRIIEFLLVDYTLPTAVAFIGLIIGGIPVLWKEFQESVKEQKASINVSHWITFVISFAVVAWMAVADISGGGIQEVEVAFIPLVSLFLVGMISAAAMVIPGISGSLLMLIIGYYYAFLFVINGFTSALSSMNPTDLLNFSILAAAYGFGMLVGIALISKVIDYLFKNHPVMTYVSIFGLVLASPIAIVTNTGAFEYIFDNSFLYVFVSLAIGAACFFLTYFLGQANDSTETLQN